MLPDKTDRKCYCCLLRLQTQTLLNVTLLSRSESKHHTAYGFQSLDLQSLKPWYSSQQNFLFLLKQLIIVPLPFESSLNSTKILPKNFFFLVLHQKYGLGQSCS